MEEGETVEGNITLTENFTLRGVIVGNVTVRPNTLFDLQVAVTGSLYIEQGAEVRLRGTVYGSIHNQGSLSVAGRVNGKILDDGQQIIYEPGAVINGEPIGPIM